jgi:hypothetical protein
MVFNRHVLAIDVTGFAKALAKRGYIAGLGRPAVDESDHRHRRLLRAPRAAMQPPRGALR